MVRFPRQRVRHQARRRQRSSRHRRHRPRPMRRPINQEARKCANLRTFSRRRFHHQISSAAGSSRNCTNLPSFRMLHVCRIPMRVLSPPADSWKMCAAGNTYRGTRSGAAGLACGLPMSSGTRCGVALHPRGELASIVARYATIAEPGHSSRRSEWGSSTQFRG